MLVLLFSIIPVFFIEEPRVFEKENVILEEKNSISLYDGLSLLFPLYGFILFGLFVVVNKAVWSGKLDNVQTKFMYVCLAASIILGTITILKGVSQ